MVIGDGEQVWESSDLGDVGKNGLTAGQVGCGMKEELVAK